MKDSIRKGTHNQIGPALRKRLCCKNNEEIKRSTEPLPGFRLGDRSKPSGNQGHLASHIPFVHALYLPFPSHVHHLKSLECSPRCLEREKAHPRLRQALGNGWMNRWPCSIRLLRYFTCRNSQCSGRMPAALSSAMALGYAAFLSTLITRGTDVVGVE